jgi:4-hydroxy-tetrahydrodipicolinate reductase
MTIALAVAGAAGRMGRAVIAAAAADPRFELAGACERHGAPELGRDAGSLAGLDPLGVTLTDNPAEAAATASVLVDFTTPAATIAALAAAPHCAFVIGATGFSPEQEATIATAARSRPIVKSGNFSLGVNVLAALVRKAAAILGPEWDIEIVEAHHRRKADAPSGTALLLGEAAAAGRAAPLETLRLPPHDGLTGPRTPGGIGFAVVRGGGIIGEHEVILAAEDEVVRLSHQARERSLFARGALAAAAWATGQPPGLYDMADVLGL